MNNMMDRTARPPAPVDDMPPALATLLNAGSGFPTTPAPTGIGGAAMGSMPMRQPLPSYQMGGMVGPGGMPEPPMQGPGLAAPGASRQMSPQQIQAEAQRFVQRHPQQVQQIQMAIQQAMQSGELTMQELNMMVQMATVALQNPDMYPQLRALAIQQGLATEQDISPQFDPGLLFVLIVIGQTMSGGAVPGGQQVGAIPSMEKGGMLPNKGSAKSEPVIAQLHEGEYVIPANVVKAKGTEFFDKLVKNYQQAELEIEDES